MWIDSDKRETDRVLAVRQIQPGESIVRFAEQGKNRSYLVSRHPLLVPALNDLVQNRARFGVVSRGRKHMRALGASGRRVSRKDALLVVGGERFGGHPLFFVGPTKDRVSGD